MSFISREYIETEYWPATSPSSRVQVMPAHGSEEDDITIPVNSQVVLMHGDDPISLEEQADMMRANKDKFKCLYLLVETAIAMRRKELVRGNVVEYM